MPGERGLGGRRLLLGPLGERRGLLSYLPSDRLAKRLGRASLFWKREGAGVFPEYRLGGGVDVGAGELAGAEPLSGVGVPVPLCLVPLSLGLSRKLPK